MIAENNLESHGSWDTVQEGSGEYDGVVPCDRPEWLSMMLDRVNSMYQRDKKPSKYPHLVLWKRILWWKRYL